MENEPTHEFEHRVEYCCPECGHSQLLDDDNTIMFIDSEDEELYAYIKCDVGDQTGDCEPYTWLIQPEQAQYYSNLSNWYNSEGRIEPVLESVEVIEVNPTILFVKWLNEYDPQPWEFERNTH